MAFELRILITTREATVFGSWIRLVLTHDYMHEKFKNQLILNGLRY